MDSPFLFIVFDKTRDRPIMVLITKTIRLLKKYQIDYVENKQF